MAEECVIVVFPSTHHALKAERVAKEQGLRAEMIPVPRDLSSDCNMGMKVSVEDEERTRAALEKAGVSCRLVRRGG